MSVMKSVKGFVGAAKGTAFNVWKSANEAVLPAQSSSTFEHNGVSYQALPSTYCYSFPRRHPPPSDCLTANRCIAHLQTIVGSDSWKTSGRQTIESLEDP